MFFLEESERLFTGLRCAAKKGTTIARENHNVFIDLGCNRMLSRIELECLELILLSFVVFSAGLWATAGLLPLIGVSFAFAILLVNQDLEMFHYVFAAFCFSQV